MTSAQHQTIWLTRKEDSTEINKSHILGGQVHVPGFFPILLWMYPTRNISSQQRLPLQINTWNCVSHSGSYVQNKWIIFRWFSEGLFHIPMTYHGLQSDKKPGNGPLSLNTLPCIASINLAYFSRPSNQVELNQCCYYPHFMSNSKFTEKGNALARHSLKHNNMLLVHLSIFFKKLLNSFQ